MANLDNFSFDEVKLTDYIDESLIKLLNRDNASRISFRCSGSFPSPVSEELIGMTCYRVDLKAEYRLVSVTPDPQWLLISNEAGTATNKEEVAANYQKKNANLTSISNLSGSADKLPYFSGKDNFSLTNLSAFARTLLSKLSKEEVRTLLGLGQAALLNTPINGSYLTDGTVTLNKLNMSSMGSYLPPTGTCWLTVASTAPAGWVMANDGTIGSASSGASKASAETKALFQMLWKLPVTQLYTATGNTKAKSSTSDIDWAANCRLSLPKVLGRVLGVAGNGAGLTRRALGSTTGAETHKLTVAQMPAHTHSMSVDFPVYSDFRTGNYTFHRDGHYLYNRSDQPKTVLSNTGGGQAHNIMQPTSFLNLMIKL